MMSSDELREHLSAYLDGQLSGDLLAQMEQRLKEDDRLRAELEELREMVASLGSFPVVNAPPGFASRVMAGVDGLPLPVAGGLAEFAEQDDSDDEHDDEYMNVPWWLKSAIALSAAAALALAIFVVRVPLSSSPVDFGASSETAEVPKPWGLPMATGGDPPSAEHVLADAEVEAVESEADTDGVVALEDEQSSPASSMPPADLPEPSPPPAPVAKAKPAAVETRSASSPPAARKKRQSSGLKEVARDREFPAGVFQAPHEDVPVDAGEFAAASGGVAGSSGGANADGAGPATRQAPVEAAVAATQEEKAVADEGAGAEGSYGDGVVALDDEEPAPSSQSVAEPTADKAPEEAQAGNAVEVEAEATDQVDDRLVQLEDVSPSGASIRGGGGSGRVAGRGSVGQGGSARASNPAKSSDSQAAAEPVVAEGSVVVVSEERAEQNQNAPSIAVKLTIGSLYLEGAEVITSLTRELKGKGWSVDLLTPLPRSEDGSPTRSGKQILQLVVPGVAASDLARLLSSYGTLNTDRKLAPAPDGKVRLRLTVRWGD